MGKKTTTISIAVLVIIIIAGLFFYSLQSTIQDQESILKSEYTTYWADATDESFDTRTITPTAQYPTVAEWTFSKFVVATSGGGAYITQDGIIGFWGSTNADTSIRTTKDFKGLEFVVILTTGDRGGGNVGGYKVGNYPDYGLYRFVPHTLNPNIYDVYKNGLIETKDVDFTGKIMAIELHSGSGGGGLAYVGYRALLSCDLSPNEVWIQSQWVNSVDINDLTQKDGFIPTKFCKETRPFVLRDIQQGETAIYPDPIPAFNRGEKITSPLSNQLIVVNYATYFVSGVNNPTALNQANKCLERDSNYKCLRWSVEDVIKPLEIVVQCKVDEDCPQPLKNMCPTYFIGCKDNICTYDDNALNLVQCNNQVVTTIKQTELVKEQIIIEAEAENTFSFTQNKDRISFYFGDVLFTGDVPSFNCIDEVSEADTVNSPNPRDECWQTTAKFGSTSIIAKNKEIKDIDEFIRFAYIASGTYVINPEFRQSNDKTSFRNDDWGNSFYFSVRNGLEINIEEENKFILQNAEKKIKVNIKNNLPRNTKAFVMLKQTIKATNENLPEEKMLIILNSGENVIEIPLSTANLGLNNVEIRALYPIESTANGLIKSDAIITNYQIVTELPSKTEFIVIEKEVIKYVEPIKEKSNLKTIFMVSGIAVAVILIIFLIIWLIKRK